MKIIPTPREVLIGEGKLALSAIEAVKNILSPRNKKPNDCCFFFGSALENPFGANAL